MLSPVLMDKCLFIPAWWLRGYNAMHAAPRSKQDAASGSTTVSTVLPAYENEQYLVLLAALNMLQMQLLKQTSESSTGLTIAALALRKRVMVQGRYAVESVLQSLPNLRLLVPTASEMLRPLPFFADERWRCDATEDATVHLTLAEPGAELLLGYVDGYAEFVRVMGGETPIKDLLPGYPPLMLWKSIWADLSGYERLLYARLEKAMQWDFRWLQLDGIFGMPLDELFAGLPAPQPKVDVAVSEEFAWRRRQLERVGKKLTEHGLLHGQVESHYLAVGSANRPGDFNLTWQISQDRLVSEDLAVYQDAAVRTLVKQRRGFEELLATDRTSIAALRSLSASVMTAATEQSKLPVINPQPGMYIDLASLFVEWSARMMPQPSLPLPEIVRDSQFARLVETGFSRVSVEGFLDFVRICQEAPQQLVTLLQEAGASVAMPDIYSSPIFKDFVDARRQRLQTPAIPCQVEPSAAVATPVRSKELPLPTSLPLNKAPNFNIKRLASEELAQMRHKDPKRYIELKQTYLQSLEPARKKIILEVQQHMQPEMFDEHLKHSLIKFMLDHPASWSSASLSRPPLKS